MLFEIYINEHWIDNPGNEAGSIKTIHLFDDLEDGSRIKSLACNLYETKIQISEKIN